jgi:hypothetical protein
MAVALNASALSAFGELNWAYVHSWAKKITGTSPNALFLESPQAGFTRFA